MKYLKLIAVAGLMFFTSWASAQAPKIGYINLQGLVELMPEYKTALAQLEKMANQMDSIYGTKINEYKMLLNKANDPTLSEVEREAINQDIDFMEQRIQQYQDDAQARINTKKAELLQPVVDKANATIKEVAKENGYTYVIDNSISLLIVMPPGDDIMPLVKKKLGIL